MKFRTIFGYFLICLIFVTSSCLNKKQKLDEPSTVMETNMGLESVDKWVFDSLTLNQRVGGVSPDSVNSGMLIDLFLEYPTAAPDSIDLEKMQSNLSAAFLADETTKLMPFQAFKLQTDKSIENALENIKEFDKWKETNEALIDVSNYNEARNTRIDTVLNNIMVVSTATYDYLGGAHGSYNVRYYNFDVNTGQRIGEADLFGPKSLETIADLIRQDIKNRNKSSDQSQHVSLLVDLKKVEPNDNYYFTGRGITYVYNQYEIAPYSQGIVEISLPYSKILPYVQDAYLPEIEAIINNGSSPK